MLFHITGLRTKPNRMSINKVGDNNRQEGSRVVTSNQTGSSVSNGAEGVKVNSQSNNNNNNNGVSSKEINNVLSSQNGNADGGGGSVSGSHFVPNSVQWSPDTLSTTTMLHISHSSPVAIEV